MPYLTKCLICKTGHDKWKHIPPIDLFALCRIKCNDIAIRFPRIYGVTVAIRSERNAFISACNLMNEGFSRGAILVFPRLH